MSIDLIRERLGPVEDKGLDGDDDGGKSWSNAKGSILVHYDVSTRRVTDIFVASRYADPRTDKRLFLVWGNLKESDPHYSLRFVPRLGSDTQWMGVEVTPN